MRSPSELPKVRAASRPESEQTDPRRRRHGRNAHLAAQQRARGEKQDRRGAEDKRCGKAAARAEGEDAGHTDGEDGEFAPSGPRHGRHQKHDRGGDECVLERMAHQRGGAEILDAPRIGKDEQIDAGEPLADADDRVESNEPDDQRRQALPPLVIQIEGEHDGKRCGEHGIGHIRHAADALTDDGDGGAKHDHRGELEHAGLLVRLLRQEADEADREGDQQKREQQRVGVEMELEERHASGLGIAG